jgi:type I restriction enzyme S subunit
MIKNFVRFGDLFDYENKSKIKAGDGLQKGKYPFYTSSNELSKYLDEYSFDKTSLIFGTGGNASIHYSDAPFSVSTDCVVAIPKNESIINPKFVFYYLSGNINLLEEGFKGAGLKHISKAFINEIQIPLPPLATQKRIAEILDSADALRRKDQELLKKYDELAQAIFIDMFGDPVKNEMGWEVKKLKEICLKITDGTHFSPPNLPIGIPYITAKHLKQDVVDFYSNPTYISQKDHDEIYSRCTPEKGDVLYIKDGATTGIAAVNEYDFEFSMLSSLALIKPQKDKINSYYLSCYLNNKIVKQELIRSYMAGAAIKRFTLEKLNKFEIVVPHIDLQNSFAIRWIKLQESITSVKKSKATILFDSLIQKAFKGELVS